MAPELLFDIHDTFDTTIPIGDKTLPIHVKNYTRGAWEAFEEEYGGFTPLGDDADVAAKKHLGEQYRTFAQKAITEAVTIEAGFLRYRGQDVTTGAGLIEMFHARADVLGAALLAIVRQNRLTSVIAKNSTSPRASGGGSEASIPTRGGDAQGSTATSAAPSGTAASAPATAASAVGPVDDRAPSGSSPAGGNVH